MISEDEDRLLQRWVDESLEIVPHAFDWIANLYMDYQIWRYRCGVPLPPTRKYKKIPVKRKDFGDWIAQRFHRRTLYKVVGVGIKAFPQHNVRT